MSADQWCLGWNRTPHVPDGGLIEVRAPLPTRLCKPCWKAWTHDDTKERQ
jgi:hypothetical protein